MIENINSKYHVNKAVTSNDHRKFEILNKKFE